MRLDPLQEYDQVSAWIDQFIGEKILLRSFVGKLSSFLNRTGHPVKVKCVIDRTLDPDDFSIGAEYNSEADELGRKPFLINFIINHSRLTPWTINKQSAEQFKVDIVETLCHEYIHLSQYRSRKYKDIKHVYRGIGRSVELAEDQNYLSHPDEIEAYAWNIAVRYYINEKRLNTRKKQSFDYDAYKHAFGKKNPVILDLESKIDQNLNYLREKEDGDKRRLHRVKLGTRRVRSK